MLKSLLVFAQWWWGAGVKEEELMETPELKESRFLENVDFCMEVRRTGMIVS